MRSETDGTEYCSTCGVKMVSALDDDPNGDSNCTCIRCRTEEGIDFDLHPDAKVNRNGTVEYTIESTPLLPHLSYKLGVAEWERRYHDLYDSFKILLQNRNLVTEKKEHELLSLSEAQASNTDVVQIIITR